LTVSIVEIIRRSEQGVTEPFVCRADDDNIYFVKGCGAGRKSLINELIAGNIAAKFGLPIAPFKVVYVAPSLIELPSSLKLSDLGHGFCFGSQKAAATDELNLINVPSIDASMRLDIIMFDWWIKNGDRSLSGYGGNPNLLWAAQTNSLTVIDHNNAFDPTVDIESLRKNHVFREEILNPDIVRNNRDQLTSRFRQILADWDEIIALIPEEWFFSCQDPTIEVHFDLQGAKEVLRRFHEEEFWT